MRQCRYLWAHDSVSMSVECMCVDVYMRDIAKVTLSTSTSGYDQSCLWIIYYSAYTLVYIYPRYHFLINLQFRFSLILTSTWNITKKEHCINQDKISNFWRTTNSWLSRRASCHIWLTFRRWNSEQKIREATWGFPCTDKVGRQMGVMWGGREVDEEIEENEKGREDYGREE